MLFEFLLRYYVLSQQLFRGTTQQKIWIGNKLLSLLYLKLENTFPIILNIFIDFHSLFFFKQTTLNELIKTDDEIDGKCAIPDRVYFEIPFVYFSK